MEVTDLAVNRLGGALTGGPGWINSVRYGADDLTGGQPNATNSPPAKPDQLHCLHLTFQRDIRGNVLFRQVTFRDNVKAIFAPVDNWDAMLTTEIPTSSVPRAWLPVAMN